jgi:hypothetical protein
MLTLASYRLLAALLAAMLIYGIWQRLDVSPRIEPPEKAAPELRVPAKSSFPDE